MHFVWTIDDETPLTKPACELGTRTLAERMGVAIPADAVVILKPDGVLGYPLAQAWGPDGSTIWLVDYRAIAQALFTVADAALRAAGLDPSEPTFERQARRLVRRRFPHWPEAMIQELFAVLPRLENIAIALEDDSSAEAAAA